MDNQYLNLTDEEIIMKVREDDSDATEYLLTKYRGLVKKEARTMYLIGADSEDLIQEGMIGLFKAIRDFRFDKDASFFSFAKMCIQRQVYSAVTASARKKHTPLNSYVSLHAPVYTENKEMELLDTLTAIENNSNPEEMVIDQERIKIIQDEIASRLSPMENEVLTLYLEGMGYIDIAEKLHKEPKSIDNAIQRIRKKLSDM